MGVHTEARQDPRAMDTKRISTETEVQYDVRYSKKGDTRPDRMETTEKFGNRRTNRDVTLKLNQCSTDGRTDRHGTD